MEATTSVWTPPQYDLSRTPKLVHTAYLSPDAEYPHNFARLVKWCPDGSLALAQCENRSLQFLNLPPELLDSTVAHAVVPPPPPVVPRTFIQPSPLLDFAWYPSASSRDLASFCFVVSVRECPVKLLDATDGRLRASYKIVDHRERQIAPHSLAFNVTADKLYCGFEDAIEVFDVYYPGEGTRLHTTPNKRSRDGLKGIISALAFAADTSSGIYAAGSLSPSAPSSSNIALFSETTGEVPVMFVGAEKRRNGAGFGIRASVSQLMFNPTQPYLLYGSFRRNDVIYNWDLRGDVSNPVQTFGGHGSPFPNMSNRRKTNQRMRFDVDISGRVLGIGDQDGHVSLFDVTSGDLAEAAVGGGNASASAARERETHAALRFKAHDDAVGSVVFHPLRPYLLSVSGSRHFDGARDSHSHESDESSSSDSESDGEEEGDGSTEGTPRTGKNAIVKMSRVRPQPRTFDSSAKLWNLTVEEG
ncbi:hypothetical protein SCP_1000690 [Sparassis crispa]|uniref:Telomerase Cajal body protein n=1 Tax=Sparassis crispa TaxID=139825 RepID=A0A401GX88_9APHY|nr:hypothetical protein SCP_1000690 [Sparassis crispa]GBE86827.1 hypothetical protein SCP_1000690 [Sparassis crispa]